jgi:integrase
MGREGSGVRAASESTIEITFTFQGKRCRERIKGQPTAANLKSAVRFRASILEAIYRGAFDYATTFPDSKRAIALANQQGDVLLTKQYLHDWMMRTEKRLASSTALGYRKIINNILTPAFGHLMLSQIKRGVIRDWGAQQTCSNKRIANILSVLRSALEEAVEDDLIESNPLAGWIYANKEALKVKDDIDPFTAEEQAAILSILDGQAKNLIQFAFWTGLRTSELVALEWNDIDFTAGIVRVRRAKTQAAKQAETTKTKAGVRDVKLLSPALQSLIAQKSFTFLSGSVIFNNPRTNEPWEGDQPIRRTIWDTAIKKSGVRYRNPYQTRHTYASMMLTAGEHPMWVANQMGHADWGMIRQVYGRFIPNAVNDSGDKAVALFGIL